MDTTKVTRTPTPAGFAPAGKLSHRWISGSRRRAISGPLAVGVALLFSAATALWSQGTPAYTYSVLHAFTGAPDGGSPYGGLVRDKEGNLYGTTSGGGNSSSPPPPYPACTTNPPGCGVVFKVDPKGKETILYNFTGGADGGSISYDSTLIRDEAGNLYGTTDGGGSLSCFCGVVYKVDPAGNETVLHAFTGGADGNPGFTTPTLSRDKAGNLYGATIEGGDLSACLPITDGGCGVVYKVDPAGNETVLYTFNGVDNNAFPDWYGPLVRDEAGNFYGTTVYALGAGTVFKLDPAGNETTFYTFTVTGASPYSGLIRDQDGNLYGTTTSNSGTGTVFKVDPAGKETTLYSFTGGADSGATTARLVRDPAGNLYGTTVFGGDLSGCFVGSGCGVVFKVDPAGKETVLYSFTGAADGGFPEAGLVLDEDGNLYGTTNIGGDLSCAPGFVSGCGVVFKLTRVAAGSQ
jgi:uncharacterized repeat protein (TIGR03803 family)